MGRWRCLAPTAIAKLNQHLGIRTWPFGCVIATSDGCSSPELPPNTAWSKRSATYSAPASRSWCSPTPSARSNPAAGQQAIRSLLYYHEGMEETAVFEFFARKLPTGRDFFVELAALNLAALSEPMR